jgi:hypothetical protein
MKNGEDLVQVTDYELLLKGPGSSEENTHST